MVYGMMLNVIYIYIKSKGDKKAQQFHVPVSNKIYFTIFCFTVDLILSMASHVMISLRANDISLLDQS